MKFLKKRRRFKLRVIKRNPAELARFQGKVKSIKLNSFLHSKPKSEAEFNERLLQKPPPIGTNSESPSPENERIQQTDLSPRKTWWTPVWNGLVMEETAKHQKAMRQAVWLYLFLLTAANRRTGVLYRKLSTITQETGFRRRSVERWLRILREKGYIETVSTGRALQIKISKWKPITGKKAKKKIEPTFNTPSPDGIRHPETTQ